MDYRLTEDFARKMEAQGLRAQGLRRAAIRQFGRDVVRFARRLGAAWIPGRARDDKPESMSSRA
jgi:hypothetical protein